jgi:hypothetical protein
VTPTPSIVPFHELKDSPLGVDTTYQGGLKGHAGDEPISKLLNVGNSGGFRISGTSDLPRFIVLYTSLEHRDWPDYLDLATGTLTYYGDNRTPGRQLHDTPRKGNVILRNLFANAEAGRAGRSKVVPIFLFSKTGNGRDVKFRGLAVPGSTAAALGEDLVAVWRSQGDSRFQNYRATFTILDVPIVSRQWIADIMNGDSGTARAPEAWLEWVATGKIIPLISEPLIIRDKAEQLPEDGQGRQVVERIHNYFNHEIENPFLFEKCAVDIWKMAESNIGEVDLTRPWRDGGRDAVGTYLLGAGTDRLRVDFALEAKCYGIGNAVGVRDVSRLISRLRHRQFGVFVTTSYFNRQAYQEIREDQHPVVLMPARDVVGTLSKHGISDLSQVNVWLRSRYRGAQ